MLEREKAIIEEREAEDQLFNDDTPLIILEQYQKLFEIFAEIGKPQSFWKDSIIIMEIMAVCFFILLILLIFVFTDPPTSMCPY